MSSINFSSFSTQVNNFLNMLPKIEATKQRVYQALEPGALKDNVLESLDFMRKNVLIIANLTNIGEGAMASFSKLSSLIEGQVTFMSKNVKLITFAMLTLFASETNYVNPESATGKKIPYLRTTLKTVGYVALATALMLTLSAKGQITSGLSQLGPMAAIVEKQSQQLLALTR